MNWLSKLDVGSCHRPQCRRPRTPHVNVRGGAWKYRARRLVDQTSIKWKRFFDKTVALCSLELVNEHSDRRQWAQFKSMGAWSIFASPFASQLASHQRHRDDFACQRRVAMLTEAQRSIISTRYNKALSRAFLSRARSANNSPSQVRVAVGDQVMYWRGNNKRKSQWSMRWLGPGIVIGHEGRAKRVDQSSQCRCQGSMENHVRLAEVEEQLPWHDLYDSLRDTDDTLISVRLVRLVILSMKVHPHRVMLQ